MPTHNSIFKINLAYLEILYLLAFNDPSSMVNVSIEAKIKVITKLPERHLWRKSLDHQKYRKFLAIVINKVYVNQY